MTPNKINRAFALAGIAMPTVRAHITRTLEAQRASMEGLTAKQLSAVIQTVRAAYHEGRASTRAQVVDDCIWVGDGVDKLLPLAALKAIEVNEQIEIVPGDPSGDWLRQQSARWTVRSYSLSYSERT